ncbi:two-component system, OmpR family, phosphate regulon response regulator OmpR [Devosia lucknowensis]|uniref:Regulatory protein VirG n=1 Tax=Devosia lucknowensis TaxID=1096929 RepID=A0A1Y6F2I8_9HYPH|nr:response regulator [Devosia lucknowensis]SMQ68686.1 two-component system, OmpR family, phosphate regulon response regulator OmpR [Devosia lucknowensis]
MQSHHILVVDDDPQIRRMLRRCLEDEGFRVSESSDGENIDPILRAGLDLVTLDLNLGRTDGLALARRIRQTSDVPIIMITGKGDMIDRIVGLEIGADDYIAKPFHLREVLARIRSVLRRSTGPAAPVQPPAAVIAFDGFMLDPARRSLTGPDGNDIALTTGEFDLLLLFCRHAHMVLERDRIMDLLKGHDWAPNDRSIDNQVARLRKLIEADTRHPQIIKTVRGAGYSFTPRTLS